MGIPGCRWLSIDRLQSKAIEVWMEHHPDRYGTRLLISDQGGAKKTPRRFVPKAISVFVFALSPSRLLRRLLGILITVTAVSIIIIRALALRLLTLLDRLVKVCLEQLVDMLLGHDVDAPWTWDNT